METKVLDKRFPIWKSVGMETPLKIWRMAEKRAAEDVARQLGVTMAMWSRWETGRRKVPAERVLDVEAATGISRHELRPDVFGPKEGAAA